MPSTTTTTVSNIANILKAQAAFFKSGRTRGREFRLLALRSLKSSIQFYENEILEALKQDLGKSEFEAYTSEVGFIYEEINYTIKRLKKWMKPSKVSTPILHQPTSSKILSQPKGLTLIIAPWNYPFQLCLAPVIGSISAGNCAVVKASEISSATEAIVAKIIKRAFATEYVTTIEGGVSTTTSLLEQNWDHIFFTGSTSVGRIVAKAAAEHLTPVTLELGGKSPCIVDKEIDIKVSARRIVWGKFYNNGQTCVAPDYLLVHKEIKESFIQELCLSICEFYGDNPSESPDYGRIINDEHFDRLVSLMEGDIVVGGNYNKAIRYIAPTIINSTSPSDKIMQDEIFGPLLPILEYENLDDALAIVNNHPNPLACYVFTKDSQIEKRVETEISYGGGCINNALIHLTNPNLPFGGIGNSGLGSYHGRYSFDTFSHKKSLSRSSFWLDLPLKYPPYKNRIKLVKKIVT